MKPLKSLKSPVVFFNCISRTNWIIAFLLFLLVKTGVGQKLNDNLTFTPKGSKKLYDATQTIVAPNVHYSEQEKKQLKKLLLERVEETLFNLEDDSTGLADDYTTIWGETFLKEFKKELTQLRIYLKEPNSPLELRDFSIPFYYVPPPYMLEKLLKETVARVEKKPFVSQKEFIELNVIKTNLLNKYLLERYTSTLRHDIYIRNQNIDIQYINQWRAIEKAYTDLQKIHKEVLSVKADIFSYNQHKTGQWRSETAQINLADNGIVEKIKHSLFIKKWLWYTGGVININPLLATSKGNAYPPGEKNSFFTPEKKRFQDSLNKMPVLDHFRQSEYIFNQVHLPLPPLQPKSLCFNLIEYDARQDYKTRDLLSEEKYLINGEQLKIAIYNIPAKAVVSAQYKEDKLLVESNAIKQLNAFADQISVITSMGIAQKVAFANVTGLLNPGDLPQVQTRGVKMSTSTEKKIDLKSTSPQLQNFHIMIETSDYSELKAEDFFKQRKYQVKIENQIVPLTETDREEDKRRILWSSAVADFENKDLVFLDKAVEAFIRKNRAFFLDYSTELSLIKTAKELQDSFITYLNTELNNHINEIDALLKEIEGKIKNIVPFVKIYNRSLPEANLEPTVDTVARHYTRLIVPEIPVAPKTFKYILIEEQAKSPAREVAQKEFKVIRPLRFDFSAGLGINLMPYEVSHSSGSALPVTDAGNRFQFVAGGHWYIFDKLNKLEDRVWGKFKERFSLYGGLSIQKALDNYYLGVSYDVWPGVRLIGAAHFYRNQSFKIINNSVAEKASGIEWAAPFISINVEPATLGKTIGLFK